MNLGSLLLIRFPLKMILTFLAVPIRSALLYHTSAKFNFSLTVFLLHSCSWKTIFNRHYRIIRRALWTFWFILSFHLKKLRKITQLCGYFYRNRGCKFLKLCNSFLDLKDYFRRSIQRLIDHKSTSVPTIKSRLPMIILPRLSSL